jgi:hypothetical protein
VAVFFEKLVTPQHQNKELAEVGESLPENGADIFLRNA